MAKFQLSNYDCIGFDLDHTLIQYRLDNLYHLVYNSFMEILVSEEGYDACLLEGDFEDIKDFCLKGLVLDIEKGNFLKLRSDGFISRASHGTRHMSRKDIINQYGDASIYPEFSRLKDNPTEFSTVFRLFENYFDLPVGAVCAHIVDVIDEQKGKLEKYTFWPDVLTTLLKVFSPSSFSDQKGMFFPSIIKNTSQYVKPCSKETLEWIKILRSGGKKIFLLTNSNIDYSNMLLKFAVGADWAEMFDVVVCLAGKPGFFTEGNSSQFRALVGEKDVGAVKELQKYKTYSRGNVKDFSAFLQKCTAKENPAVLYFGDSLKSDLYSCTTFASWDVVAIVEEMEAEGIIKNLPASTTEKDILMGKQRDVLLSNHWGSFFNVDPTHEIQSGVQDDYHLKTVSVTETKQMETFCGQMISKYSVLAIPQIDCLTGLSLDHSFGDFC